MITNTICRMFSTHTKICIIGGGTGGLNLSTHLLRNKISPNDIRIFEPAKHHYYQPGWTMVGSGLCDISLTERNMSDILPKQVYWTKDKVLRVDPDNNTIYTDRDKFTYDHIVFASGLQLDWDKIKGARQLLDNPNSKVASIYSRDYVQKVKKIGDQLKGGQAIFHEPAPPIKCAGAPQKIMYLWADAWRKKGIPVNVQYIKFGPSMFGVPKYSTALAGIAKGYNINSIFNQNLVQITEQQAIFEHKQTKEVLRKKYDFLHISPPMSAHSYIKQSGVADAQGYVDLDKGTLRHNKYPNVWGIGDCTSLPNSKTAAAAFSQTEILIKNMKATMNNKDIKELPAKYEGYASCPLLVGQGKLLLAEFKYGGEIDQTFFNDQEKPRRSFYFMKRYLFPQFYWHLVPRGLWGGRKGIKFVI